jgi:spore germination protein YaaH
VVPALARAAREGGARSVTLAVPAPGGVHADPALLALADRVLVMLYDEHWSGSAPGPVASPAWVDEALARWLRVVPAGRLVAALPVYGYLWRNAGATVVLSHQDLRGLEAGAGRVASRDSTGGAVVLELGEAGTAWYTDVQALHTLRTVVRRYGIGRVALWRLGLEDAALWHGGQELE